MTLDRYLLKQFFPVFLTAISMFVFILLLIDMFSNLVRYITNEVPVITILQISFYYIPKCISYALPISLLFAAAYTLGDLYEKNELTTIFSAGIPLWRLGVSLIMVGLAASVITFFLDDVVVIPTLKLKNDLSRQALRQHVTQVNSDIVIRAKNGNLVYYVDYFDFQNVILNGISIVETDESGNFISQIRSPSAAWNETYWEFRNAVIYRYDDEGILRISQLGFNNDYNEPPDSFRRNAVNIDELSARDAGLLVQDLKAAGLPYFDEQANYYQRYSFAAASLIVMILSISMSGRYRKNILLMSLFTSLSAAVVYNITEIGRAHV